MRLLNPIVGGSRLLLKLWPFLQLLSFYVDSIIGCGVGEFKCFIDDVYIAFGLKIRISDVYVRGSLRLGLFIWFVYTFCLYTVLVAGCLVVGKVFKGFRFDPELYLSFRRLASSGGCTATGAFERFAREC